MNDIILKKNSNNTLIICFTGFRANVNDGIFEWYNIFKKYYTKYDLLFLKDLNQRWYLTGIKSITSNVNTTFKYLSDICCNYNNVCLIGSSMGGYASILYGYLLSKNHNITIKSFSPQVSLIGDNTNKWTDKEVVLFIDKVSKVDKKYLELHKIINKPLNCTIFYGKYHPYDHFHYDKISKYVNKIELNTDKHAVARFMKDQNILDTVLQNIF